MKTKILNQFYFLVVLILLYFMSKENYLLFHTIIEFLPISLAVCMLLISITKLKIQKSSSFDILSFGYAGVAFIDLFHTLAFKGMGVFKNITANEPTQFWILARILEAAVILYYTVVFISKNKSVEPRTIKGIQ